MALVEVVQVLLARDMWALVAKAECVGRGGEGARQEEPVAELVEALVA